MHKRTKACAISKKTKERVFERDMGACIFCGAPGLPEAHVIPRSHGGKEGEDLSRHDKWLCMMYPRLKLLHKLLAEDGFMHLGITVSAVQLDGEIGLADLTLAHIPVFLLQAMHLVAELSSIGP